MEQLLFSHFNSYLCLLSISLLAFSFYLIHSFLLHFSVSFSNLPFGFIFSNISSMFQVSVSFLPQLINSYFKFVHICVHTCKFIPCHTCLSPLLSISFCSYQSLIIGSYLSIFIYLFFFTSFSFLFFFFNRTFTITILILQAFVLFFLLNFPFLTHPSLYVFLPFSTSDFNSNFVIY